MIEERHNLQIGERIGVWTRPSDDQVFLFGFGRFLGDANVNGVMFPAVKFDMEPEKEYVLHYGHIWYGRESHIRDTIGGLDNDIEVHNITLTEYLDPNFKPPKRSTKVKEDIHQEEKTPRNETAFDKLYRLGSDVSKLRQKIKLYDKAKAEAEEAIATKQKEMADLKARALSEIDALERGDSLDESSDSEANDETATLPEAETPNPNPGDQEVTESEDTFTCEICGGTPGACACTD